MAVSRESRCIDNNSDLRQRYLSTGQGSKLCPPLLDTLGWLLQYANISQVHNHKQEAQLLQRNSMSAAHRKGELGPPAHLPSAVLAIIDFVHLSDRPTV